MRLMLLSEVNILAAGLSGAGHFSGMGVFQDVATISQNGFKANGLWGVRITFPYRPIQASEYATDYKWFTKLIQIYNLALFGILSTCSKIKSADSTKIT